MLERIKEANILVYGRVTSMEKGVYGELPLYNLEFTVDVYCVLMKKNSSSYIGNQVKILSETLFCVSNNPDMVIGREIVVMLRELHGGLTFHNVNMQGAVFEATEENMKAIGDSCLVSNTYYGQNCPALLTKCTNGGTTAFRTTKRMPTTTMPNNRTTTRPRPRFWWW